MSITRIALFHEAMEKLGWQPFTGMQCYFRPSDYENRIRGFVDVLPQTRFVVAPLGGWVFVYRSAKVPHKKVSEELVLRVIRKAKRPLTSGEIKDRLREFGRFPDRTVDYKIMKLRKRGSIVAVLDPERLVPAYMPAERYKEGGE